MKPLRLIACAIIAATAVASCDSKRPPETPETETATTAISETTSTTETTEEVEPPEVPVLEVEHHPFPMEHHRLKLTVSDPGEFIFHKAPTTEADVAKRLTLEEGQEFAFERSRTRIPEPLELTSRVAVRIDGTPLGGGDLVTKKLPAGEDFRAYLYAGEGLCYIELDGKLMVGTCPDAERFQADGWDGKSPMPESLQWWVQTRHGWHLVDLDRFEREQVSTL